MCGLSHVGSKGEVEIFLVLVAWALNFGVDFLSFIPMSWQGEEPGFRIKLVKQCFSVSKMQERVLMGKRQRRKVAPSGDPGCQMLVSNTCSLNLGLAPKGEELTMETVMAVCSGSLENEKRIETQQCLRGERHRGPLGGETNLTTEQNHRAQSPHLSSV